MGRLLPWRFTRLENKVGFPGRSAHHFAHTPFNTENNADNVRPSVTERLYTFLARD